MTTATSWESMDVTEMRYRLDAAVIAAHQNKAETCQYFLREAWLECQSAGWEKYREEFFAAQTECKIALKGSM